MVTGHIGSITGNVRGSYPSWHGGTRHVDKLNESQDKPSSIEGMTAFCSPNIDEVSVQVKYKNEMYIISF